MKVDMAPKAVKGRLKLVSQLWRLSISLQKAKKETDARRKGKVISQKNDNETFTSLN
ncbi:MAG: hypothetical protein LC768_00795 [Acidobacteria bacterium]|nr:hypothetical protein [Acidobacteriota bacterium]MCA1636873.1 hypothetical protein [Acidobacteriota bacterium]